MQRTGWPTVYPASALVSSREACGVLAGWPGLVEQPVKMAKPIVIMNFLPSIETILNSSSDTVRIG